jgi:hypothetical protein
MTTIETTPTDQRVRPAWRRASIWSFWIGVSYAAVIMLARLLVIYRFGGQFLTPYFAVLLASAVITAGAVWPALAHAARRPIVAETIRSILQWSAILGLGASLLIGAGALADDQSLQLVQALVAKDLIKGH